MNRSYIVIPLVGLVAFAGYFAYWKGQPPRPARAESTVADPFLGRDGRKEAESEFAAGKLAVIETGAKVAWDRERREIAAQRYGVELRSLEPASATEAFARYVDGFNRFMRPKILARHGAGFFDNLHREALAMHEGKTVPGK